MMQGAVGLRILCLSVLICLGAAQIQAKEKGKGGGKKSDPTDYQKGQPSPSGHEDNSADNAADSLTLVTSANKAFAFNLYRQLANQSDNQGKNIFFSPSSVSLALAALSVGARGQTHQQIFTGLGFNISVLNQDDINQAFHGLLTGGSNEDISAGTAVFVDNKFKPKAEFLDNLRQSYLTEGSSVDFTNSTASAAAINKYVGDKTHGKINQLVEELDPDTLMYLISYVYYKGKWKTKFNPRDTDEEDFFLDQQTQILVQTMYLEDKFHVHYDKSISTHVLRLPFNNSYSMLLMLPDEGRGLTSLEDLICPTHYARWISALNEKKREKYVIRLPKFSIKTNVNLNDVLRQMGITDVFDAAADLSGISEDHSLCVSQVVHQATLDVDESGATAAAVTSTGFVVKSMEYVPELTFNRPFMVFITDRVDNILFMGKIVNPTL